MSRRLLVWVVVVLVVAFAGAVAAGLSGPVSRPLDPANPDDDGTQALVRVLEQQGVTVEVVRGAGAVEPGQAGPGTTVLLESTDLLSGERGRGLLRSSGAADRLVVLAPHARVGEVLDLPVSGRERRTDQPLQPRCELGGWQGGDTVQGAAVLLELEPPGPGAEEEDGDGPGAGGAEDATVCLPPSASFAEGGQRAGYLVGLPATRDRPETLLLGFAPALTNGQITEAANAAAGLRLLGGSARLLWVVPSPADAQGEQAQGLLDVLPRAVGPSAVLALLALGALALWRGRRLGPLVSEPLPVVVRASETVRSRGRLYQRGRDREHALRVLQHGARGRLLRRLALAPDLPDEALVAAVAAATGRPEREVARALTDPRAEDDETLVQIARQVRSLEEGALPR